MKIRKKVEPLDRREVGPPDKQKTEPPDPWADDPIIRWARAGGRAKLAALATEETQKMKTP